MQTKIFDPRKSVQGANLVSLYSYYIHRLLYIFSIKGRKTDLLSVRLVTTHLTRKELCLSHHIID